MTRDRIIETLEYLENKRISLGELAEARQTLSYAELTSTLYGLTGAMFLIVDHIRRKEGY